MKDGTIIALSAIGAVVLIGGGVGGYFFWWNAPASQASGSKPELVSAADGKESLSVEKSLPQPTTIPTTQPELVPIEASEEKVSAVVETKIVAPREIKIERVRIHGGAWIARGGGQSDVLRGLDILTVQTTIVDERRLVEAERLARVQIAEIKEIPQPEQGQSKYLREYDERVYKEKVQEKKDNAAYYRSLRLGDSLIDDLSDSKTWLLASQLAFFDCEVVATTDINGEYEANFVYQPGMAIGALLSSNAFSVIWFVPLDDAGVNKLDLYNKNAAYIRNWR